MNKLPVLPSSWVRIHVESSKWRNKEFSLFFFATFCVIKTQGHFCHLIRQKQNRVKEATGMCQTAEAILITRAHRVWVTLVSSVVVLDSMYQHVHSKTTWHKTMFKMRIHVYMGLVEKNRLGPLTLLVWRPQTLNLIHSFLMQ